MTVESFASNTPQNTSILQLTKFTFIIPDMPFLKYFCQTVSLPGVSTTEVAVPTPFSATYHAGDKAVFEPLTLTTLIDEDMRVWEESYKWFKSLTRPTSYDEYRRKGPNDTTPLYYDGFLTINTNANNPNIKIKFFNCHPTSIGGVTFDTKTDADNIPTFDITFRYDYFVIERF